MDPQATLKRWRQALKDGDSEEANYARGDLARWLRGGGFAPKGLTKSEKHQLGLTPKKNPRRCRGSGKGNKRLLVCKGKRDNPANPKRIGESDTAYAHRLESEMREVKKKMTSIASRMKKIARPRKNPANPKRHFPKTKRGRPPVDRRWSMTAYNADGKVLKRAKASMDKTEAYKQAKGMIGKTLGGGRIAKVILDGPK